MDDPGKVRWKQTMISGELLDQWFGHLPSRGDACFASISQVINGTRWNCNVFTENKEPGTLWIQLYAPTREKGMAWIERWARHHWESVKMPPNQRS